MHRATLQIFRKNLWTLYCKTDQLYFWLLLGQWLFAIALAIFASPYSWIGKTKTTYVHVQVAVCLGALINAPPFYLILTRPGWWLTRHSVAVVQMLWSAVLIHLTGGRIETQFHVFGSLAFLAFYRDWRVLTTATVVAATDKLAREFFWPESVYGISHPEWWRFLEHSFWVVFEDFILILGCRRSIAEMVVVADREAILEQTNVEIERQVEFRTDELGQSVERYRSLVENTNVVPWEFDCEKWKITYLAPQASRFFGCENTDLLRDCFFGQLIHCGDRERVQERIRLFSSQPAAAAGGDHFDYRIETSNGRLLEVRTILSPYQVGQPLRGFTLDITQQKKLESELYQAQKLESVGRLAAGVAHEINTPVQFVSDSVHFLKDATNDLIGVVEKLQVVHRSVLDGAPSARAAAEAREAEEAADLQYLFENMPKALDRSLDGLGRVAEIVRSMKEFAHPDSKEMSMANLNRAIESTLTIARNEYKYLADLVTDLGELPLVTCHLGDVNQAILNIAVNAAHAIGDVVGATGKKGRISVRTRLDGDSVVIAIADTGRGIPEHIRDRIFDPFFTTKEVGKGTGQGLSIARSVVVEKHHGEISFETETGKGTTFFIRLPVNGPAAMAPVGARE